jgi:D-alanyl-D-alanine carboxypeptidase
MKETIMEQQTNSLRRRRDRNRQANKKTNRQKLLIFLILIFVMGFVFGFLIGSRREKEINFVLPESTPAISETPIETPTETPEKTIPENLPWNLTLVNFEHPLDETFKPSKLAEVNNGYIADKRIADATKKMIADARSKDNVRIIALSAYRDYDYQMELFENKVIRLQQEKGYSVDKAREEAKTVVAYPGTSEHQLGLALDLVDARHVKLDESQENTAAYKWLYEHCHEYGFIVRYPNGKTDITGIIYEPWHFRYVGVEAATFIMENNLTLEEYLLDHYTP